MDLFNMQPPLDATTIVVGDWNFLFRRGSDVAITIFGARLGNTTLDYRNCFNVLCISLLFAFFFPVQKS